MDVPRSLWRRACALDPWVRDTALALALLLASWWELSAGGDTAIFPALASAGGGQPDGSGRLPLAALTIAPVVARRRWPLPGYGLQVAAWTLAAMLTGHLGPSISSLAALLLVVYSAGAYSDRRVTSPALVVVGSVLLSVGPAVLAPERFGNLVRLDRPGDVFAVAVMSLMTITAWLVGDATRARRRHVAEAKRAAVAEERTRIARELHDVVAHGVSVMIVQAEAARRVLSRDPAQAAGALRTISATGAEALDELQHLLSMLGAEDGPAALEPAPGLARLEPLLARMRAAGVAVRLRQSGERRALPRGVELTAYRIIQEALTNVLKHAGGAGAEVHLDYRPDHLRIDVVDDGRTAAPAGRADGRGLLGMRERVAGCGGELTTGHRPEGGYAVRVRLPVGGSG